jgi:hypothetical protein
MDAVQRHGAKYVSLARERYAEKKTDPYKAGRAVGSTRKVALTVNSLG